MTSFPPTSYPDPSLPSRPALERSEGPARTRRQPNILSGAFLGLLLVLFLAAFGYAAFLFFQTARTIVASAPQFASAAAASDSQPASEGQSRNLPTAPNLVRADTTTAPLLPPLWNEQEPINILLLGIDQRPGETGYYRTDTMLVAAIDPAKGDVGLLSIPRDLWVIVPGYWETRINSAHVIGDSEKYPGGGPALAKATVSQLLDEPIHYYVRINFEAFHTLLTEIGCIEIEVPRTIDDPLFPDDNYGYDPFYIEAGMHCMDAETALKYARTRNIDSDFGRMQRQQQVLIAIKDKVLSAGELPHLIARLPALLNALSDSVHTDMPASQRITLANTVRKLNLNDIRRVVIDETMTERTIMPSGADVLIPRYDRIQPAVEAFFYPERAPAPTPSTPLQEQLAAENLRVAVLNGTPDPELARQVAERLAALGFNVVGYGEADHSDYAHTQIIDYSGGSFTARQLAEQLAVPDEGIRPGSGANIQADVQIILGADFTAP